MVLDRRAIGIVQKQAAERLPVDLTPVHDAVARGCTGADLTNDDADDPTADDAVRAHINAIVSDIGDGSAQIDPVDRPDDGAVNAQRRIVVRAAGPDGGVVRHTDKRGPVDHDDIVGRNSDGRGAGATEKSESHVVFPQGPEKYR